MKITNLNQIQCLRMEIDYHSTPEDSVMKPFGNVTLSYDYETCTVKGDIIEILGNTFECFEIEKEQNENDLVWNYYFKLDA